MFSELSESFHRIHDFLEGMQADVERIPIVGSLLANPISGMLWFVGKVSWAFGMLDYTTQSLLLDYLPMGFAYWIMAVMGASWMERQLWKGHFIAWILVQVGFDTIDALMFESSPGWFIRWKITTWFDFLDPLLEDPFGWIKEKILERVPALGYLLEDPEGWVLYMLGVPWFERFFWSDHLLAWLLHRWGLPTADALMFESDPISWVKYQVLKRWDFLDDLLLDPPSWIWDKFTQAVDRYIDVNIDWLVGTVARVLNTIWQTRI